MLKNISPLISPELLKILAEMGHGDEIVLSDRNFPAASIAKNTAVGHELRFDTVKMPELLEAVLSLFPLDARVEKNVFFMTVGGDFVAPIWADYKAILSNESGFTEDNIETLQKQDFYDRAKKAYAVVLTGETARCANIIIRKGTI